MRKLKHMFGRRALIDRPSVGVGTVYTVEDIEVEGTESATADTERQVLIQVTGVRGEEFIGRLVHRDSDLDMSKLRPGLVVLVAFDPTARERLSLPDDVLAVRASCPQPG
jgi:hypothetical protein